MRRAATIAALVCGLALAGCESFDPLDKFQDMDIMGSGSAGDVFLQAQYPLHSGRIAGLAGRILISASGLIVLVLTWTGIYLWLRKRFPAKTRAHRSGDSRGRVVRTV